MSKPAGYYRTPFAWQSTVPGTPRATGDRGRVPQGPPVTLYGRLDVGQASGEDAAGGRSDDDAATATMRGYPPVQAGDTLTDPAEPADPWRVIGTSRGDFEMRLDLERKPVRG